MRTNNIIFLSSLCVSVSGWGLLPPPPLVALKRSKSLCKKCLLPPPPLVALKKSKQLICKKKKKRNNLKKKLILGGVAAAGLGLGGVVAVGGAAVALNQLNNGVVYEPEAGSLNDQVVLITGASSGLGLESAKRLAAAGATVVLTSRTKSKGEQAVEDVKSYLTDKGMYDAKLYSLELDLDDLGQVRQFPESFKELGLGDVSILMNNAGVMAIPSKELTKDGFERTFQSNHLGHFVLTASMFPYLSRDGAKVINVASSAANFAAPGLDIDNLNGERSYAPWSSYGQSKLANILFTNELQKKADAAGLNWLTAVSLHPGVVNTDLWRYIVGEDKFQEMKETDSLSIESLALSATSLFTKTPEQGANNQVFLAAGADGKLVKGAYYDDMKLKDKLGFMKDEDKAASLWEISEDYAGLTFDLTGLDEAVDDEVVEEAIEEAVISVLEDSVEEAAEADTPSEDETTEGSVSDATEEAEEEEEDETETEASLEDDSSEENESEVTKEEKIEEEEQDEKKEENDSSSS
ncbi:retinol dehydrogenase-related protein [Skeletonema marinoi]|uniref:Retinol dehydrogenase-related protein n=1 Tax=Skeletonema marinoi TaxID=267567 RepID=A0AAD9D8I6_9STRA|nr:retinol dehydrogenase-related protein [Skeletonema marinoi]